MEMPHTKPAMCIPNQDARDLHDSDLDAGRLGPAQARREIRAGRHTGQTSGLAFGYVQGNVAILPAALAGDFLRFCQGNPKPCPLIGIGEPGNPMLPMLGSDIDIRTDVPSYRVFRYGELADEVTDIRALWRDDLVAFVLGCSYLAADDPTNEAVDIAGLTTDVETARKVTEASKGIYEKLFREKFGVKLLAIGTYPAQVIYCNAELRSLSDVKGKKVRVAGRSQSELIEALGGTPVTMAFGEVVPALQNKTVDCGITGTLSGNLAKWHEVTTHLIALPVSWGQIGYAVNMKSWDKMDPRVRNLIETEIKGLEKAIWDAAALHTAQGLACNAGQDDCKLGSKGKVTLVQPTAADKALLQKIVTETMVPKWAARCSAECVAAFNGSIGKVVNITAKK